MINTPQDDLFFKVMQEGEKILIKHLPKSYLNNHAKKFWALRMEIFECVNKYWGDLIKTLK